MSLWQKVKGMSKKARAIALSVALALAVVAGGLATGLSLSNKNSDRIGSDVTAESTAMGTNMTQQAPTKLGSTTSSAYRYSPGSGQTLGAFQNIPAANVNGCWFIDTPGKWLYAVTRMNAKDTAYLNANYIFAGGVMDFGGASITPGAVFSANPFTGIIYGNKTTIQNVTINSIKDGGTAGSSTGANNFCGMIAFAANATFYDLAFNTNVSLNIPSSIWSDAGALVGRVTTGTAKFINVGSFINGNVTNTCASEVGANWGGIVGNILSASVYFNGCTYCGTLTRVGAATSAVDNQFRFGGLFGCYRVANSTLEIYNSSADIHGSFKNTGPIGGPFGAADNISNQTFKIKNAVCRIDIKTVSNVNTPDYGLMISTYNSTFTTNCLLENIYMYGTMSPTTGVPQESWMNAKNSSGQCVIKNVVSNITPTTVSDNSYASSGQFTKAGSEKDVIQQAQNNTGVKGSGIIVNDDGTVGSGNIPPADFTIIYVDQLNTSGLSNGKYNSSTGATFPTRTASGATFNGWSVGSWTATPAMSFQGGGRIGDLTVYARWTLNDSGTTKSVSQGQNQTITYGANATFTVSLVHPQVTAGKAQINIDGWYTGSSYGTKLLGVTGTGTGTNNNIVATTSGTTYTLTFTKPTVAQSMTYRLKYTIAVKSGVNGVANTTGYYDITLKVNKATVTNPTFETAFTYDTDAHNVVKTAGGSTLYTAGGTLTATNAGDYTATFTLKDAANYKWATTSGLQAGATLPSESGVITVKWSIKQASFNDPTPDPSNPDNPNPPPKDPGYNPWIGQGEDPKGDDYDPRLDPTNPGYEPKLDPNNPSYDPTIDPRNPQYDPKKDPANPYGDNYDPSKDPRKDPNSGGYDPTLDPDAPEYDPKIDPDPNNPGYVPELDPHNPNSPAYDGENATGSYVKFEVIGKGIVGLTLNNAKNNDGKGLTVTGAAWITYANGKKQDIPGTFSFKNPGEYISYDFFNIEYALKNNNESVYKTIVVFTPNDKSISPYEREIAIVVIGHFINISEQRVDEATASEQNMERSADYKLWIDYGRIVTITPKIGQSKIDLTYFDGGVQKSYSITKLQTPKGYYATLEYGAIPVAGKDGVFTLDFSSSDVYYSKTFIVHYKPNTDTSYTVYYVLESTGIVDDGQRHYTYDQNTDEQSLKNVVEAKTIVFKATATGATASYVRYDENGQIYSTSYDMGPKANYYELDEKANAYLESVRIKGDGSTYIVVFLKAKYITVTFLAVGSTDYPMQTQEVKYGGKIDVAKVKNPSKNGANFDKWYYSQSGNDSVVLANEIIEAPITYYAHFDNTYFYVVFDMNTFSGRNASGAAPDKGALNLDVVPTELGDSYKDVEHLITWNYSSLFGSYGAEDFYLAKAQDPEGRWNIGDYVFRYTVDSLTKNLSLTSSAVKPSALAYTFVNWYSVDSQGKITTTTNTSIRAPKNYTSGTTPEPVITIKASWKVQNYTLVFDKMDGSRTTTVSGVANLSTWADIYKKNATIEEPVRTGYVFDGWYATPQCSEGYGGRVTEEFGAPGYFSVSEYKDVENADGEYVYKTENSDGGYTYNFSTIRLYAGWKNVEIGVGKDDGEEWKESDGGIIVDVRSDSDEGVYLDYDVTVDVQPDEGYEFSHLIVGKTPRYIYSNGTNSITFTVYGSDVDFSNPNDPRLELTAVFTPITYTISYNMDGGTSYESRVTRTYTIVDLNKNDVELPSRLRKQGYNFQGWKFENTNPALDGNYAFNYTYQPSDDLYDEDIRLSTKLTGGDTYCGNLTLIAVWTPKPVVIKLHNVDYKKSGKYDKDAATDTYYEVVNDDNRQPLATGSTVTIENPKSDSFDFIGWATTRGGEVVYAAELGEDGFIQDVVYTAKSDFKLDGSSDPNANHLYAVWKVTGFDYVVITAEGNGNVYDGNGIKLSAITSKQYTDDPSSGSNLTIQYIWYRVNNDGKYENIFQINKRIYIDADGVEVATADYTNGVETKWTWNANFNHEELTEDEVRKTYAYVEDKVLLTSALEENCTEVDSVTVEGDNLTEAVSYVVPNVAMAGNYICVAEVFGSVEGEGKGIEKFGEITVTMPRAEFRGVVFQSRTITYDGLGHSIKVALTGNDKNVTMSGNVITLPDKDNKGNDNKAHVNVTYKYKLKDFTTPEMKDGYKFDAAGNPVNDDGEILTTPGGSEFAQEVVNAGIYTVTAYFSVEDYANHSYNVIESLPAELEIAQRKLTNVTFGVEHDADGWTDDGLFSETYDGKDYVIVAHINDTDLGGKPLVDVTNGNISLQVNVYATDEYGKKKGEPIGNPVNAGTYVAEINTTVMAGANGDNSANYTVGAITTLQTFVIEKARLDYGLSFKDAEVTFDNAVHTISVTSNNGRDPLPTMLNAEYSLKYTSNENLNGYYGTGNKCLENDKYYPDYDDGKSGDVAGNGGRHAGVYEISVAISFKDAELGKNYESVSIEPATLTIKKANLISYYDDGDETNGYAELFGNDFKSSTYSYIVSANQMKYVSSPVLDAKDASGAPFFTVHYTVSRQMDSGSFVAIYTGTKAELTGSGATINAPGTYKIDAEIAYESPVYKNDFENVDVQTIEITINKEVIKDVEIVYTEDAYKDGVSKMLQYVGETFNVNYLERIIISYEGGEDNKLVVTGSDLDPANGIVEVLYDNNGEHSEFWKIGESIELTFRLYGYTKRGSATIKIMQKITTNADLKYSVNGGSYNSVPADGLDLEEISAPESAYSYRLYFDGVDERGDAVTNLYVAVEINPADLVRGENALNISTLGLYDFSELEVTLNAYKLIDFEGVTWKYSTDGRDWTVLNSEATLPYIARQYYVGIAFTGDDGNEVVAYVQATSGDIINAGEYDMVVDELYTNDPDRYATRNRFYRINNVNLGVALTIQQHELSLTWEHLTLKYTGEMQKVNLLGAGVLAEDAEDVAFEFSYYKLSKNSDGSVDETLITEELIVNAGDYRIRVTGVTVVDGADIAKAGNYAIPENNYVDFTIEKASIRFERVYYFESGIGYGYDENTSYQNNPQGLRTDKLFGRFGSNKAVEGDFYFVVYDTATEGYVILNDIEAGQEYLKSVGSRQVMYMYSPLDMRNYEVLIGRLDINVKTQTRTNDLRVVRKTGAAPFYIVDSVVAPDRFDVFQTYTSFYVENGVEYGKFEPLTTYRAEANGSLITEQYKYKVKATDSKIVITVYHSSNSNINGSIEFAVYQSQPTKLVLSEYEISNKIKADWYVGETFMLDIEGPNKVIFQLYFLNDDPAELTFFDVTYTVDGVGFNERDSRFTSAGVATITFSYAGLTCELELTIKPKEDLVITTPQTKTVKYEEGKEQDVPVLEFLLDGETVKAEDIAGVEYTYEIMISDNTNALTPTDKILNEGTYVVIYYFKVTNPRFNTPDAFRITVNVKSIAYQAVWEEFDEAELTSVYTGNEINPPTARVSKVKDLIYDREYYNGWTVTIVSKTRENESQQAEIISVGRYTITAQATYNGEEIGILEYTYTVTQAVNSATVTAINVLVGGPVGIVTDRSELGVKGNILVEGLVFSTFDEATMISYSDNSRSGFSATVPSAVGTWYVKLEVQGTADYATLTVIEQFNINYKSLGSVNKDEYGDTWVDVEGGKNGLDPSIVLDVLKVEQAELGGLKIKNNRVSDGYDISLIDGTSGEPAELTESITLRLLLSEDLRGLDASKIRVYRVTVDAKGRTKTEAVNAKVSEDGKYLVLEGVRDLGRFVITEKLNTVPVGLLVGVIVCAVIAAGLIVACVLVFLKKREII